MKQMNIGIIGLGLIGGSMAKAIKDNTEHTIFGFDIKDEVVKEHDFVFIGGHPMAGIEHSGFTHSKKALFNNASMVLVPIWHRNSTYGKALMCTYTCRS